MVVLIRMRCTNRVKIARTNGAQKASLHSITTLIILLTLILSTIQGGIPNNKSLTVAIAQTQAMTGKLSQIRIRLRIALLLKSILGLAYKSQTINSFLMQVI